MSSPVGYATGIGALMGAAINLCGVIVLMIWSLIAFSTATTAAASGHAQAAASAGAGFAAVSALARFIELLGAPFWGAVLGAFGGLIGGSMVPRAAGTTIAQSSVE